MPFLQRVLVLGAGTAGLLAALTLKRRMADLDVTLVHSPRLGVIGVGEGTTPTFPAHLHGYLDLPPGELLDGAGLVWKLGVRFDWGPRPFNYPFAPQVSRQYAALSRTAGCYDDPGFSSGCVESALMSVDRVFPKAAHGGPTIGPNHGYHVENAQLAAALRKQAVASGVAFVEGEVAGATREGQRIVGLRLRDGQNLRADLFVDASGFASQLLGQELREPFVSYEQSLLCDRAVVGGWSRPADEPIRPYTTSETMRSGWSWRIDHERRINRGYVYSSAFLDDASAEREFRERCPRVESTRVVRFRSGRYRRAWVGSVVAIGNASGFVEPLEATALGVICTDARAIAETLAEDRREPGPTTLRQYNRRHARNWDAIRDFLAVHYRFNRRLESDFWRACWNDVDLAGAGPLVDYYRERGPSIAWKTTLLPADDTFGLDGYWTILRGLGAPTEFSFPADEHEQQIWSEIRARNRQDAAQGLTVPEALSIVRLPHWRWDRAFYRRVAGLPPRV